VVRNDVPMAYFSAVLTLDGGRWRSLDVDVEEAVDVDDLAEEAREAAEGGGAVLVVLEREDEWFALVRADGGEPRTFVSDLPAVSAGRYAELLAAAADAPAPQPAPGEEGEDAAAAVAAPTWAGDTGLLEDLGLPAAELTAAAERLDPAGALVEAGERCGFVGLLEALR
jgi:putative tRNA adenosine deaminase-associated protein